MIELLIIHYPDPDTSSGLSSGMQFVVCQGTVFTGLWVLAHECGHGAFSSIDILNNLIGFFLHSFLLVPYFSWKISHRKHHLNTGNLEKDEVFVPSYDRKSQLQKHGNMDKTPLQWVFDIVYRFLCILGMLLFGWPSYLIVNATSNANYPIGTNHFSPFSAIFTKRERPLILLSDLGVICMIGILIQAARWYGIVTVIYFCLFPYLITNAFLVLITFLQHTDVVLPHYSGTEWDWLRGALATIDRDYSVLNFFHHHIGDTHIVHHLFPSIPHYHAQEATTFIRKVLGQYYRNDDTPIPIALWKQYSNCNRVVEDQQNHGIYWF